MTVIDDPKAIKLFGMKAARQAILLEAKGLRHSRLHRQGGVRGLWARHYGMPPRSKADAVIARLEEDIRDLEAQLGQGELPL